MSDILFSYKRVEPTTWAYLSSLLIIALYFKFSRVWSVRNLDLIVLVLLSPGLLLVKYGLDRGNVAEVAVVGKADPLKGQIVKAFVVVKPGAEGSPRLADEIAAQVKITLGRHQYPREIEFVAALPKTQTGKIQRFLLRQAGSGMA